MNVWNKITLGTKFLFGGWESALDYLLGFLNTYLAKDGVAEKVTKVRETCAWALDWLLKLRVYVPTKWHNEYNVITDVVADVIAVANDGKITAVEIKTIAASFAEAKAMWDAD
jgi:hypothetical protein